MASVIVSASRRTDIPSRYADWFFNRLKEGYVFTRNPYNPNQVGRVTLSREGVDGFVFWTKNAAPMLPRLNELDGYKFYFQFTITPYGRDTEADLPDKNAEIIPTFKRLAEKIGADNVIWRYDPIFISEKYSADYHMRAFDKMSAALGGYTKQVTISFIDFYRNVDTRPLKLSPFGDEQKRALADNLAETARRRSMRVCSCAEDLGLPSAVCVDGGRFGVKKPKDASQRGLCECAESVDIGAYGTCPNGCLYCYANRRKTPANSAAATIMGAPLTGGETVKQRN